MSERLAARYAVAIAASVVAVIVRLALDPLWGMGLPLITFFPAIMASAWFGGFGPGIVTTLLSAVAANYFWMDPRYTLYLGDSRDAVALAMFVLIGVFISGLTEALHRARRRQAAALEQEHAAAAAIAASEARLKVTITSIGDAVIATDDRGRIALMNGVAQSLSGWSDADAIGRPLADVFTILNERSRRPVEDPVDKVLREGKITGLANHTVLVAKDGREIPIDDSAAPIRNADGRLLGAVLVFRDISQRREVERERATLLDHERTARADAERLAARQRHLLSVTDITLSPRALDDLVRELLSRLRVAMASDTTTILLLSEDGAHLTPFYSDGLREELSANIRIPLGRGVAGRIALSDQGMIINDLATVEVMSTMLGDRVKSLVGTPLKVGGRLLGVIHAGTAQPRRFSEDDLGLLRLVADRAALAIERARLDEAERTARVEVDRRRGEAEAAEQRLRLALEAGRMGTWEWTIATGAVRWSSGLEAIHGFASGTFPGTFEAVQKEIHPDDRDRVLRAIGEAVEERRDHQVEYRIVRRDGAVRWVEGRGQLFCDAAGRPERMVGVCADVTERKQTEERFRLAVEAAPTAMVLVDQQGTIRLANALAESLFGYMRHELIGRSIERLVPSRFRDRHSEYRARFFADPRRRAMGEGRDLYALRKNGTEVPVEIGLSPLETADGVFVVAAVTDITERKRAEQRQAAQHAVTRVLAEAATLEAAAPRILEAICDSLGWDVGALWTVDRRAAVLRCVDVWHRPSMKVAEFEEVTRSRTFAPGVGLIGRVWTQAKPIWVADVLKDDNFPRAPFAAQGGLHGGFAFPIRLAGDVLGVIEFFSREVRQPDRDLLSAMAGIGSQIGQFIERRRAEEERAQLLVREKAARQEAETANHAKDEFLAMLSHELRTPLNTVLGWTRMLRSKTLDEAAVARALEAIERNARAQAQLIEDLLDVSRIVSGKLHLELRPVDLVAVARAATEAVQSSAETKGIRLEIALDPSMGPITADPGRLRQVVLNLLSNAIKFTPAGGRVELRLECSGSRVTITVSDTGKGISADFLPYVFDRFRQAPSSDPDGGLGLGLAIVRHIVELHGGSVQAASAGEGQGSTFTVNLPIVALRGIEDTKVLHGLRILVVDEDADTRELLATVLARQGATVSTAVSVADARAAIASVRPDVLVCDVAMPGESGAALIREVRMGSTEAGDSIPAIALTAKARAEDRQEMIAAGFQQHLPKPVEPMALVQAVAALTRRILGS